MGATKSAHNSLAGLDWAVVCDPDLLELAGEREACQLIEPLAMRLSEDTRYLQSLGYRDVELGRTTLSGLWVRMYGGELVARAFSYVSSGRFGRFNELVSEQRPGHPFALATLVPGSALPVEEGFDEVAALWTADALHVNASPYEPVRDRLARVASGQIPALVHEIYHGVQWAVAPGFMAFADQGDGNLKPEYAWVVEGTAVAVALARVVGPLRGPTSLARILPLYIGGSGDTAVNRPSWGLPLASRNHRSLDPYAAGILFYAANDGDVGYLLAFLRHLEENPELWDDRNSYPAVDAAMRDAGVPAYATTDGERLDGLRAAYVRAILASGQYGSAWTDEQNSRLGLEDPEVRGQAMCVNPNELRNYVEAGPGGPNLRAMASDCRAYISGDWARPFLTVKKTRGGEHVYILAQASDQRGPPILTRRENTTLRVSHPDYEGISLNALNLDLENRQTVREWRAEVRVATRRFRLRDLSPGGRSP